jgi:phospholipid/cholesterol/gamma-HCH transport system substrate-binding protein
MLAANNAKLDTLIGRGEEATRDLAPLVQTTHETLLLLQGQVLPEAHRTLTHLDDLSSSLTGVARKVNRDPSVLIRGARPATPGPGETP